MPSKQDKSPVDLASLPIKRLLTELEARAQQAPDVASEVLRLCKEKAAKQQELLEEVKTVQKQTPLVLRVCITMLDGKTRDVPCTVTRDRSIQQLWAGVQQVVQLEGTFALKQGENTTSLHGTAGVCVGEVICEHEVGGKKLKCVDFVQLPHTFQVSLKVHKGTCHLATDDEPSTAVLALTHDTTVGAFKAACSRASGIGTNDIRIFIKDVATRTPASEMLGTVGGEARLPDVGVWTGSEVHVVDAHVVRGVPIYVEFWMMNWGKKYDFKTLIGVSPTATFDQIRRQLTEEAAARLHNANVPGVDKKAFDIIFKNGFSTFFRPQRIHFSDDAAPHLVCKHVGAFQQLIAEVQQVEPGRRHVRRWGSGNLWVKALDGQVFGMWVDFSSTTLLEVKQKIQELEGIPVDQLRFPNVRQNDERTLADCGLDKGSLPLDFSLRMRGGMFHTTSGRQGFDVLEEQARDDLNKSLIDIQTLMEQAATTEKLSETALLETYAAAEERDTCVREGVFVVDIDALLDDASA